MLSRPYDIALLERLAHGPASAAELTKALGISQPTLSRAMGTLERQGQVTRTGSTRGARYSLLTRTVDGIGTEWPLYRVGEEGRLHEMGAINALPMLFAPQNDQIVERQYEPVRPTAASLSLWPHARALAEVYWELLSQEPSLSSEFRELSGRCLAALRTVSSRGLLASETAR
jgi:DNA-binding HxlR family transcriptional regulator